MSLSAKGRNGQLFVDEIWITITRKGFSAKVSQGISKGEKKIPIKQIIAVQFKKPSLMTAGYIQFTISGGKESTKGILSAMEDENSIVFGNSETDKFIAIKDFIENKIAENISDKTVSASGQNSVAEQLTQLAALHKQGFLTDDEFKKQKDKLLNT